MGNYTKQDIIQLVEEKDVQFIRLQFTDVSGTLKNVAITASQLESGDASLGFTKEGIGRPGFRQEIFQVFLLYHALDVPYHFWVQ